MNIFLPRSPLTVILSCLCPVHTARGLPTLVRAQKDNEVVDLQQLEDLVPSTVKMAPREPGPKKVKVGKEAARKYRRYGQGRTGLDVL